MGAQQLVTDHATVLTGNAKMIIAQFPEFVLWCAGITTVIVIGMTIRQEHLHAKQSWIRKQNEDLKKMLSDMKEMLDHPDDYYFGTKKTNELLASTLAVTTESLEQNKETLRLLGGFLGWLRDDIRRRGNTEPPPLPGD